MSEHKDGEDFIRLYLTEEEARALHKVLKYNWVQIDLQKIVYDLVRRIEKELEIE